MNVLDEYKDITTHLRERHQTIWHTRNIYTIIMLAILGVTYQLRLTGLSLKLASFAFAFVGAAMTTVAGVIEYRYSLMKRELTDRVVELEGVLKFAQYTTIDDLKRSHRLAFGKHAQIIYLLLSVAYIGAIVLRAFI